MRQVIVGQANRLTIPMPFQRFSNSSFDRILSLNILSITVGRFRLRTRHLS